MPRYDLKELELAVTPNETWTAVDQYLAAACCAPDTALEQALADSVTAGLPNIQVTPNLGKLLQFLARLTGARRILEIGTLGGYSTIWLARGLATGGRLITLEIDPRHAQIAQRNLDRAGLADRVEIRLGPALETLPQLAAAAAGPFDLTFIDADKANIPAYFDWAVRLSRPGSVIVVDNIVRQGRVLEAATTDATLAGVRRFLAQIQSDRRVSVTALQTVGAKGHDGFAVALVIDPAGASPA